jgi:retron-type reverse transcriptase
MIEEIVSKDNMKAAYERVIGNKGCSGVEGMEVSELRPYLKAHWHTIKASILNGTYRPQPVKGVEIDKPKGGKRLHGIPTVLDRLIQQAMQQVLNGNFDPTFSVFSYGFRKGKSAHQAITQALKYANTGSRYVVVTYRNFSIG